MDIHLRFGEFFLLDHCNFNGFLKASGMCGVISQRRRNVFAAIVGVLATKEIVFRCYRTNEEHVPFQLLIMAELSALFQFLWDNTVEIHLRFGEFFSVDHGILKGAFSADAFVLCGLAFYGDSLGGTISGACHGLSLRRILGCPSQADSG